VDEAAFVEKETNGVVKWWNLELKDRTPAWAEKECGIPAAQIVRVARAKGLRERAVAWRHVLRAARSLRITDDGSRTTDDGFRTTDSGPRTTVHRPQRLTAHARVDSPASR